MSEREELEQSIAALEAQRAVLGDAVVDPAIAALRKELAALEAPPTSEQRKQVTVLFADVSGFTAMSETMDAEDVRDTMNDLWTRLDGAITNCEGFIDKHIGDAVMALFGAPTAREASHSSETSISNSTRGWAAVTVRTWTPEEMTVKASRPVSIGAPLVW